MIRKALFAFALFAMAVLSARWFEEGDYYDPYRGRRHCAAPPSAIDAWSFTMRARRREDSTNLDRWLEKNPGQVNRLFGAFCFAPLHSAARFGRDDLAELLIARGADVHTAAEPSSDTPLHVAAQYGHANVATVLVARGADVNARTTFGRTPLHDAVFGLGGTSDLEGRVAVAKLLLALGADVNARERESGRTPLDNAVATSNQINSDRMTQLLLASGANARTADSHGTPALQEAASHGNVTAVKGLLDGGADANAAGRDTTVLGAAAYQGNVELVSLLLSRGADASRSVSGSRIEGDGAPLAMALSAAPGGQTKSREMRRLQVASRLLDHGAEINARDRRGSTVLHAVASRGDLAAAELLLSHGAAVDPVDALGLTPLYLAVREGHVAVAARLLEKGANVRARARDGTTVVDLAGNDREMDALVHRYARH